MVDGPWAAVEAFAVIRADLVHLADNARIPVEAAGRSLLLGNWRE